MEAKPLTKIDEEHVIKFMWKNICCRFGIPRILVMDNKTQFNRAGVRELCAELRITQRFTSLTYPQVNGQVEVTNRTSVNGIWTRLETAGGN